LILAWLFHIHVMTPNDTLHIIAVTLSDITRIDGGVGRNFRFEIDRGLHT